ncbi:MAG: DUF1588 domain-containing protein [Planctomycetota bacterium]
MAAKNTLLSKYVFLLGSRDCSMGSFRSTILAFFILVCGAWLSTQVLAEDSFAVAEPVERMLQKHCGACHSEDSSEANVRIDNIAELDLDARLGLLNKVQEQIFFGLMPPEDEEQLEKKQRDQVLGWIARELREHDASALDEKLKRPEYGNYVDHEALFSGEKKDLPGYTANRRWLISEHIFNAKINDLIDYQGKRTVDGNPTSVIGDNGVGLGTRFGGGTLRQSIVNPFLRPKTIGVRYFDNSALTRGHLLTMIANAKKIAAYMTSEQTVKARYPAMYKLLKVELSQRERLRRREQFLNQFVQEVCETIYGDENRKLLPEFVSVDVEAPEVSLDAKGNPRKKETNLGLLDRYDSGDMQAIYLGIGLYKKDDVTFEQVIQRCERDWFEYGIAESRIRERVGIMKSLFVRWNMDLIYEDVRKKNIQPPTYMALDESEMQVIQAAIRKHRRQGDTWQSIIDKCMEDWRMEFKTQLSSGDAAGAEDLNQVVHELVTKILQRSPTDLEVNENRELFQAYLARLGTQKAIAKLAETLILNSEFVYRSEFGQGPADEHGRQLISPRDASYAIAYALTDSSPDAELVAAAEAGKLNSREDYRREIERMLARRDLYYVIDESVQKAGFNASLTNQPIRKIRFFREFFGYTKAMTIFKDDERFGAGRYDNAKGRLVDEADMLVAHILEEDEQVFEMLLTTENFYVFHSGDNTEMQSSSDRLRAIYDYFKECDWENFTEEQLYEHWPFIDKMKMRGTVFPNFLKDDRRRTGWVRSFKTTMKSLELRFGKGQKNAMPYDELPMAYWHKGNATGRTGQVMRAHEVTTFFNIDYSDWDYPAQQPARIEYRKGMLTHPAWLIAHAQNTETDPVRRGKWIREKLLAGTIPDVPITVDAVIPEDHHKTLRQRLEKRTADAYCWKCHQRMDPLGLAFEMYDDFGRFRTDERIEYPENLIKPVDRKSPLKDGVRLAEYKTLPVDSRGVLSGVDEALEGEVRDGMELAERLAKSSRVRQSIIRHAFRYFLGRNERLSDSKTLIDAERAYLDSNGSFDAVIVSLLTSDSFVYRKEP